MIVPTIGRDTLAQTIDSIPRKWRILVVADGHNAALKARKLRNIKRARLIETGPTNDVGHTQRNVGMAAADTDWLAFLDDDDAYVPDVEQIVGPDGGLPHIFQMRYTHGGVLWRDHKVCEGNVGTPMFVTPNDKARLGVWPSRRSGDAVFIGETCRLYDEPPVFVERVIALVRPHEK